MSDIFVRDQSVFCCLQCLEVPNILSRGVNQFYFLLFALSLAQVNIDGTTRDTITNELKLRIKNLHFLKPKRGRPDELEIFPGAEIGAGAGGGALRLQATSQRTASHRKVTEISQKATNIANDSSSAPPSRKLSTNDANTLAENGDTTRLQQLSRNFSMSMSELSIVETPAGSPSKMFASVLSASANIFGIPRRMSRSVVMPQAQVAAHSHDEQRTEAKTEVPPMNLSTTTNGGTFVDLVDCLPMNLFEPAKDQIYRLMARDCYNRWKKKQRKSERRDQINDALARLRFA